MKQNLNSYEKGNIVEDNEGYEKRQLDQPRKLNTNRLEN